MGESWADERMKTLKSFILLLALTGLLVKAQTSTEISYEDIIEGLFNKTDAEGRTFCPLLEHLHIDTVDTTNAILNPDDVDGSAVMTKHLSFLAEETTCNETQEHQEDPCPPKEEGELLSCNLVVSHPVEDISNIITSEMSCEKMEPEDALKPKIRQRRGVGNWFAERWRRIRNWWRNKKYQRRLSWPSFQTWLQNKANGISNAGARWNRTYQRWWRDMAFRRWLTVRARRMHLLAGHVQKLQSTPELPRQSKPTLRNRIRNKMGRIQGWWRKKRTKIGNWWWNSRNRARNWWRNRRNRIRYWRIRMFQRRLRSKGFRRWVRNTVNGVRNRCSPWNRTYRRWWRNQTFRRWLADEQRKVRNRMRSAKGKPAPKLPMPKPPTPKPKTLKAKPSSKPSAMPKPKPKRPPKLLDEDE